MNRVVLDTNIVVSAVLTPSGSEAKILDLVTGGKVLLCVSEPILAEYDQVLRRPKFHLDPKLVDRLLKLFREHGLLVRPEETLAVSPDEADNRFLECAEAAKADLLITGNLRHFPKEWKATKVMTARGLLGLSTEKR